MVEKLLEWTIYPLLDSLKYWILDKINELPVIVFPIALLALIFLGFIAYTYFQHQAFKKRFGELKKIVPPGGTLLRKIDTSWQEFVRPFQTINNIDIKHVLSTPVDPGTQNNTSRLIFMDYQYEVSPEAASSFDGETNTAVLNGNLVILQSGVEWPEFIISPKNWEVKGHYVATSRKYNFGVKPNQPIQKGLVKDLLDLLDNNELLVNIETVRNGVLIEIIDGGRNCLASGLDLLHPAQVTVALDLARKIEKIGSQCRTSSSAENVMIGRNPTPPKNTDTPISNPFGLDFLIELNDPGS